MDINELGPEIFKIINAEKVSIRRDHNNATKVRDSKRFKGLPITKIDEITTITDSTVKSYLEEKSGARFQTIKDLEIGAQKAVQGSFKTFMTSIPKDGSVARKVYDSYWNIAHNIGTDGDPSVYGAGTSPNIWISPYEANSLYSQKGLPELITNKKSKTILLNGMKIKNKRLTQKQIDEVSLNMIRLNFPSIVASAVRDALVYGGALTVPMFKKDTPFTTMLPFKGLLKNGIIGKNCIDYIFTLDRWNVMHLPIVNPTQRDFLMPEKYFIPFLGSDVYKDRVSRIITGDQAGYFGKVMTLGWGLSDFVGYMKALINYKTAVQSIPLMIQQMSILVRSIDANSILAQEGMNAIDDVLDNDKMRMREVGPDQPIALDMVGKLEVVNRQFAEVPSLMRLLRQDLAADAVIPEPMLWSSEKGAFASGDDVEGNLEKQSESVKYVHKEVERQFKAIANIVMIDALGTDSDVLSALPYTELHFDVPMVANSRDRASIAKDISETYFNLVSANMPGAQAARIASAYAGDEMSIDSDLLDDLDRRQKESDERQTEKFTKEMELLDAQIKNAKVPAKMPGQEEKRYSKLEQAQHNKTKMPGEKVSEKLAKAQSRDSIIDRLLGRK